MLCLCNFDVEFYFVYFFNYIVSHNRRGQYSPLLACAKGTEREDDLSTSGERILCCIYLMMLEANILRSCL